MPACTCIVYHIYIHDLMRDEKAGRSTHIHDLMRDEKAGRSTHTHDAVPCKSGCSIHYSMC